MHLTKLGIMITKITIKELYHVNFSVVLNFLSVTHTNIHITFYGNDVI